MLTKSRSKNKTTYATTRLVLQKGLEIKAQLQKHALRVKLSSVDMRKGQEISEGNCGVFSHCYSIRSNLKKMGPLQFCHPVFLGIHRNPKQKDFLICVRDF